VEEISVDVIRPPMRGLRIDGPAARVYPAGVSVVGSIYIRNHAVFQ